MKTVFLWSGCLALLFGTAQLSADGVFDQYRDLMGDDNPAVFVIDEGEELWFTAQGPNSATLEACDLGLGSGVTAGTYVRFPRYFADTDEVMDIEARLVHCMTTIQGRDLASITAKPYSLRGDLGTEIEALVTWLAAESEGATIAPEQTHPAEREMYALGEEIFFYRAGPHDFSCATCHEQSEMRIRLQSLPDLTSHTGAADAWGQLACVSDFAGFGENDGVAHARLLPATALARVANGLRDQHCAANVHGSECCRRGDDGSGG